MTSISLQVAKHAPRSTSYITIQLPQASRTNPQSPVHLLLLATVTSTLQFRFFAGDTSSSHCRKPQASHTDLRSLVHPLLLATMMIRLCNTDCFRPINCSRTINPDCTEPQAPKIKNKVHNQEAARNPIFTVQIKLLAAAKPAAQEAAWHLPPASASAPAQSARPR